MNLNWLKNTLNRMYKQFGKFLENLFAKLTKQWLNECEPYCVVYHWKGMYFINIYIKFHCDIFCESKVSREFSIGKFLSFTCFIYNYVFKRRKKQLKSKAESRESINRKLVVKYFDTMTCVWQVFRLNITKQTKQNMYISHT